MVPVHRSGSTRSHTTPRRWSAAAVAVSFLATACAACGTSPGSHETTARTKTVTPSTSVSCPAPTSCLTIGNVSTLGGPVPGLFEGALVGTNAYLTSIDAAGGVDGRELRLLSADDAFSCAQNEAQTRSLASKVIAFAGSFSLFDNCGGKVLAAHPQIPDVSVTLSSFTSSLPNDFSVDPLVPGWEAGPLLWFKKHFPRAVKHVGTLVAQVPSAEAQWAGEKQAMQKVGFHVVYDTTFGPLDTNFTSQVIAMQHAGVEAVDLSDMNGATAARIVSAMFQQGFKPPLVFSAGPIYTSSFVARAGGASVADGIYLAQNEALYLGGDAKAVPAVATFLHWMHVVAPGFAPDLYAVYGWASAELLVEALRKAGPDPTSSSVSAALRSIHSFDANGLMAPTDPAAKSPATCWLLARVSNGKFVRYHMPSTGFRCGSGFIRAGGATR